MGDAFNQLDQVTQQNAALVEESAAAADSLNHQAARLVEAVAIFKLNLDAPQVHKGTAVAVPKPAPTTRSAPRMPAKSPAKVPALATDEAADWASF